MNQERRVWLLRWCARLIGATRIEVGGPAPGLRDVLVVARGVGRDSWHLLRVRFMPANRAYPRRVVDNTRLRRW